MTQAKHRSTDPHTSAAAAEQAKAFAQQHHARILMVLRDHGPRGKDGIARLSGLDRVAVARRMKELQRIGLVALTGKDVLSAAGRPEREWVSVL